MQFRIQDRRGILLLIRVVLVFSLIIVVKSPDTFSEERDMMNERSNLGYAGLPIESFSINGKTFSFYRLKPVVKTVMSSPRQPVPNLTPSTTILSKGNLSADILSAFLLKNNLPLIFFYLKAFFAVNYLVNLPSSFVVESLYTFFSSHPILSISLTSNSGT